MELKIHAPEIVYANYAAKPLRAELSHRTVNAVYTVRDEFRNTVLFEGNTVRAIGEFPPENDPLSVKVEAAYGGIETAFTLKVARYEGFGWDGSPLCFEERIAACREKMGKSVGGAVFAGDSFFDTELFWTDFDERMEGKAYGIGVASSTASDWEVVSERMLYPFKPSHIIFHIGTNDIFDDGKDANAAFEGLKRLFSAIHENLPEAHIWFFGMEPRVGQTENNKRCADADRMISKWIGRRRWITYLDSPAQCFDRDGTVKADFFRDGIHPKLENYDVYLKLLAEYKR